MDEEGYFWSTGLRQKLKHLAWLLVRAEGFLSALNSRKYVRNVPNFPGEKKMGGGGGLGKRSRIF
jgi:hypothetical protein